MIKDKYFRVCLVVTIVLLLAIFSGCETPQNKIKVTGDRVTNRIEILTIDSCEYIKYDSNYPSFVNALVHKGNCKFCKQRK